MRKFLLLAVMVIAIGCSSNKTYETAIRNFLQYDKENDRSYDMDVKFEDVKLVQKITVADSLVNLENLRKYALAKYRYEIATNQQEIERKQNFFGPGTIVLMEMFKIEEAQRHLAHFDTLDFRSEFAGRKESEVIALIVNATVSYLPPNETTRVTENRDFILTPDGKTCTDSGKDLPGKFVPETKYDLVKEEE